MTTVSAIVPSRNRGPQLRTLLAALAQQELPRDASLEVVVALDGPAEVSPEPPPSIGPGGLDLRVLPLPQVGICTAKNRAVAAARGEILLFLNDDVEPEPRFVAEHLAAHRAGHAAVLGASPWKRPAGATILDDLIASTRMIFFYDGLADGRDYDFRHAWNLNLSLRRTALAGLDGPFNESLRPVYFDDIELAHRAFGSRPAVRYHAAARALHDHRYTLRGYFEREALLGVMAPVLHAANPACYHAIFPLAPADLARRIRGGRPAVDLDARDAAAMLAHLAAACARPSVPRTDLHALYLMHLPLKRRAFRAGLLAALDEPARPWPERPALAAEALARDAVFAVFPEAAPCPVA